MQKINFLFVICAVLFSFSTSSAVILKINGRKALIDLEGTRAERGDTFEALNLYGRVLGLLRIKRVANGKAIGILIKGKMGQNWILEHRNIEPVPTFPKRNIASQRKQIRRNNKFQYDTYERSYSSDSGANRFVPPQKNISFSNGMGAILGPHFNYLRISEKVGIYGLSWKITGLFDFFLMNQLGIRLNLGYQTLMARGDHCGSNIINCQLVVHYPLASVLLRGVFLQSRQWHPWLGIGGAAFLPIVDSKYDLNLDKRSFEGMHGTFIFAAGVDIDFQGFYIPVQLDLNWINPLVAPVAREGSKSLRILYLGVSVGMAVHF